MECVTVTSKHQITVPSEVRRSLNLSKGDRLAFEARPDGVFELRKMTRVKSDGAAIPYLGSREKSLTAKEMREAVAKGAVESFRLRGK